MMHAPCAVRADAGTADAVGSESMFRVPVSDVKFVLGACLLDDSLALRANNETCKCQRNSPSINMRLAYSVNQLEPEASSVSFRDL